LYDLIIHLFWVSISYSFAWLCWGLEKMGCFWSWSYGFEGFMAEWRNDFLTVLCFLELWIYDGLRVLVRGPVSVGDIILIMLDCNEVFWVLKPTGFQEKFWFSDFWFGLAELAVVGCEEREMWSFILGLDCWVLLSSLR